MKRSGISLLISILILTSVVFAFTLRPQQDDERFISYVVDPKNQELKLYWKDDKSKNFGSIVNLRSWLETHKRKLVFAMNGGMYKPDGSPQGLFIEDRKTVSPLDTSAGNGNFYLKPNGICYLTTDNKPVICIAEKFQGGGKIKYATQSGPMLIIDGQIHPAFKEGSANVNIRNGVGILPDNRLIFVMSKKEVNFYDFANYFKNLGCKNALYLDGLVSRTYLPEKNWIQIDGNFGVIIGVTTAGREE